VVSVSASLLGGACLSHSANAGEPLYCMYAKRPHLDDVKQVDLLAVYASSIKRVDAELHSVRPAY